MGSNKTDISYGKCRCCLAEGYHKDMTKEYYGCDSKQQQIYSDIFVDCFNLFLCSDSRLSTLICGSCADHLKEAYNFKIKVMQIEAQLIQLLNLHSERQSIFVNCELSDTKVNVTVKEEETYSDHEEPVQHEPDENREECSIREEVSLAEKQLLYRFPKGSLLKLPTLATLHTICPGYATELKNLKGKLITAKMIQQNLTIERKVGPVSEKFAHITNISTLLSYSNLTAFKTKFKNGFPCFYCNTRFENLEQLRHHQLEHKKTDVKRVVANKYRPGRPDCLVVYVDVTDLKCTICDSSVTNLKELKTHLVKDHRKTLYLDYTDRVVPFKMHNNMYKCQTCEFDFETFGAVERHMNTHYRNYVCEECGAGFIAKHRLKIHRYAIHSRLGEYRCDVCQKSYPTLKKMKIHQNNVHTMARKLKCPKCPATFLYYVIRQKHLVDAHGEDPILYRCNVCDKAFKRRYALSNHIKRDHLDERNFNCELCTYSCFSGGEMHGHLVKHHGEKLFECAVCKKCYGSQKSLSQHLNCHTESRFSCAECGDSFVQNRSLKIHIMKSHST